MYLRELWQSCRRRWWLLLALLILSEGGLLGASSAIKTSYDAEASVVLIPPESSETPELNRLLDLGSLDDSVEVLARSMRSADTVEALESAAPEVQFEVGPDFSTSAPILLLSASGVDREATATMLENLLERAPQTLEQLQEEVDVPARSRISSVVVSQDPAPIADVKGRLRVLGMLAVALFALNAMLVGALDGYLLRRSANRARTAATRAPRKPRRTPAPPLERAVAPRNGRAPRVPSVSRTRLATSHPKPEPPDARTGTGWPERPEGPELVKPVGVHGQST